MTAEQEEGGDRPPEQVEPPDGLAGRPAGEEDEDEVSSPGPITLDRYLSRRRPAVRMGWGQIASLLVMLVGLLMILFYREQCGRAVSKAMGTVAPTEMKSDAQAMPRVRFQP